MSILRHCMYPATAVQVRPYSSIHTAVRYRAAVKLSIVLNLVSTPSRTLFRESTEFSTKFPRRKNRKSQYFLRSPPFFSLFCTEL